MNQKIRELSHLAHTFSRTNCADENGSVDEHKRRDLFEQKFAELLIQECARTASMFSIENKRIHPDVDPSTMPESHRMVYHATCQSVSWEINVRFGLVEGVEE